MKRASIARTDEPVPLTGDVDETPWAAASPIEIDEFPWDVAESRESTVVRPLYDADALYLQYRVEDDSPHAEATELNGPVWEDSCVELFAAPEPRRRPHYFNFEVNCVGTFRLGFGPGRDHRELIDAELAEAIRVETAVADPTEAASPENAGWWAAAALPFEALAAFTGASISPESGTVWRGNVYRLGGTADPQFAAWNSVDAPEPDFHRPTDFGRLVFE